MNFIDGTPPQPLSSGQNRPVLDTKKHTNRSYTQDLALFDGKLDLKNGVLALKNVITTFFYPHIFFVTLLNAIMIGAALGAGYTAPTTLLTEPYAWPFEHIGLSFITMLISAAATALISGYGSDR
jgi:NADH:ubiquinone oxidoreductase subunit 6 (subunit J)